MNDDHIRYVNFEVIYDLLYRIAADIHEGHGLDKQDRNVTNPAFSITGVKTFQLHGNIVAGSDFINGEESTIVPSGLVLETWISQPDYKLQTVTSKWSRSLTLDRECIPQTPLHRGGEAKNIVFAGEVPHCRREASPLTSLLLPAFLLLPVLPPAQLPRQLSVP